MVFSVVCMIPIKQPRWPLGCGSFLVGHRFEDNPGVRRHLVKKSSRCQISRASNSSTPLSSLKKKKRAADKKTHEVCSTHAPHSRVYIDITACFHQHINKMMTPLYKTPKIQPSLKWNSWKMLNHRDRELAAFSQNTFPVQMSPEWLGSVFLLSCLWSWTSWLWRRIMKCAGRSELAGSSLRRTWRRRRIAGESLTWPPCPSAACWSSVVPSLTVNSAYLLLSWAVMMHWSDWELQKGTNFKWQEVKSDKVKLLRRCPLT